MKLEPLAFFGLLLPGLLLSVPARAQELPDLEALARTLDSARQDWDVPGLAVAIVHRGEVVMAKGFGVREVGGETPVDADTLFAIASNSKAFTAATLAILVEDGALGWNDRVVDHLPYFQLYDPWVTHEIRIVDLLCHRSGLRTYGGDLLWYRTSYSAEEIVRRLRYLKPVGPFRAHYGYQNLMFLTAGQVVAKVSGKPWTTFVEERIFEPLGMTRTLSMPSGVDDIENTATPHVVLDDGATPVPWLREDVLAPVGGVVSSARDLSRWLLLQLGRGALGDVRLFSEVSSRWMWTMQIPIPLGAVDRELFPSTHFKGYGLGWSLLDYRGVKVVRHGGAIDGMYSAIAMVPERDLGVVLLTNANTSVQAALVFQVLDAFLGPRGRDWSALFLDRAREAKQDARRAAAEHTASRIPNTEPSLPLEGYAGRFGGDLYGDATVTLEEGELVLRLLPAPELSAQLTHRHLDTFDIKWHKSQPWFGPGTCHFTVDRDGRVVEFELNVPNDDFWFDELEFKRRE